MYSGHLRVLLVLKSDHCESAQGYVRVVDGVLRVRRVFAATMHDPVTTPAPTRTLHEARTLHANVCAVWQV
jgi:hypothetical protein